MFHIQFNPFFTFNHRHFQLQEVLIVCLSVWQQNESNRTQKLSCISVFVVVNSPHGFALLVVMMGAVQAIHVIVMHIVTNKKHREKQISKQLNERIGTLHFALWKTWMFLLFLLIYSSIKYLYLYECCLLLEQKKKKISY